MASLGYSHSAIEVSVIVPQNRRLDSPSGSDADL